MSRTGGGDTGGSATGAETTGARSGSGTVVGAAAGRVAVVVGRAAVVGGAAVEVVVGAAVVVVLDDVEVDDTATGRSTAATCIPSWWDGTPAGEAPAQVEALTRTAARSGLAMMRRASRACIAATAHHTARSRGSTRPGKELPCATADFPRTPAARGGARGGGTRRRARPNGGDRRRRPGLAAVRAGGRPPARRHGGP